MVLCMVVAFRTSCSFKVYEGQVFVLGCCKKHYKTCRCKEIRFFAFRSLNDKTDFRDMCTRRCYHANGASGSKC